MTRAACAGLALLVLGSSWTRAQAPAQSAPSFAEFLAEVRAEAIGRGISGETVDRAFAGLEPLPVVVERDRAQPEVVETIETYLARRLTPERIATGRTLAATHAALLARVEQAYGVPGHAMVAIWGLESNFGRFTGTYSTVAALATLAYDGRRPLFRRELLSALEIIDKGHATVADLKGSWAGAMGQPQFMPSSYLQHAVDFDGDGRINIWTSLDDVFGSMANYLRGAGWRAGERWGRTVSVGAAANTRIAGGVRMRASGCRAVREMTVARPLAEWASLGVTLPGGAPLPKADLNASLVRAGTRTYLVYRNYEALLGYNCSHSYALSVGLLADRIAAQ